jgi:hypothetical protein
MITHAAPFARLIQEVTMCGVWLKLPDFKMNVAGIAIDLTTVGTFRFAPRNWSN